MPPKPKLPPALMNSPFTTAMAEADGVGRGRLEGKAWSRVGHGIYVSARADAGVLTQLAAAALRLPPGGAFSGRTAAWLHGLDYPPASPIDVTIPPGCGVSGRTGLRVHRVAIAPADLEIQRDMPVTSPRRTALDLGRRERPVDAVIALDAAIQAGWVRLDDLREFVAPNRKSWGIARLRRAVELADDGAESPMETRLRLLILGAGLPRPRSQVALYDAGGEFIARPDLLYEEERLAIEYDGAVHRETLVDDNRRQNRLQQAGYRMLRFTAPDLHNPEGVAAQIRKALLAPVLPGNAAIKPRG